MRSYSIHYYNNFTGFFWEEGKFLGCEMWNNEDRSLVKARKEDWRFIQSFQVWRMKIEEKHNDEKICLMIVFSNVKTVTLDGETTSGEIRPCLV